MRRASGASFWRTAGLVLVAYLSRACQSSAKKCVEPKGSEPEGSEPVFLLQTLRHSAHSPGNSSANTNSSLLAATNFTLANFSLDDVDRMQPVFWSGKLGRSCTYILESSGLGQTGSGAASTSTWLHQAIGLAGAMMATVSITMADVLWMIPYITNGVTGRWNSIFFMALLQVLATCSILLANYEGQTLKHVAHAQRWIDFASAMLLWVFAAFLYCDEHALWSKVAEPEATPETEQFDDTPRHETKYTRGSFVVLALLNSVDQVIVFVPLVSTNMVNPAELEVGVLISSLLTIGACCIAGQLPVVLDIIEAIPLWLLVTFIGLGALIGGVISQ